MQIGAFSRTAERTLAGEPVTFSHVKQLALTAEAVGFDSFWLPDHLVYKPDESEPVGCWEAFSFLSGLVGVTSKIQLGPFVANTAFRNPALLAKMAMTLDEISA